MPSSIFSRYRSGENRVTATFLAVLEELGTDSAEALLASGVDGGDEGLELVRYRNQPSSAGEGTPDAQLAASFNLLFETKVVPNAVDLAQLRRHLSAFEGDRSVTQRLYVLTPDAFEPDVVETIDDPRVRWMSFAGLYQAIDEFVAADERVLGDRELFLLRQFQQFLDDEGLVASPENVVVVPARAAYDDYLEFSAYVCQPARSFRNVEFIAFYRSKRIESKVARVLAVFNEVEYTSANAEAFSASGDSDERDLGRLMTRMLGEGARNEGERYKVFLLSSPGDTGTVTLAEPLVHPATSAWVQGQRYVALDRLLDAETTADL